MCQSFYCARLSQQSGLVFTQCIFSFCFFLPYSVKLNLKICIVITKIPRSANVLEMSLNQQIAHAIELHISVIRLTNIRYLKCRCQVFLQRVRIARNAERCTS